MARTFTIAGRRFTLDRDQVETAVSEELPAPIRDHYVVIAARRFPPKQVVQVLTGLDLADFTTHQARRVLTRLGFVAGRRSGARPEAPNTEPGLPYGGRQADALRPFKGKWVALEGPFQVLVAADTPEQVLSWLARHRRRASGGMFRVPVDRHDAEILGPW